MNNQPPSNKRWHQSFNQLQFCPHCQRFFWHQGPFCPFCQHRLQKVKRNILGLEGKVVSFSYYSLQLEEEGKIKHLQQIIALVKFQLQRKNKTYPLFLTLPFVIETRPEKVMIGVKVKTVLRRSLTTSKNEPLLYIPKIILIRRSNQ